MELKPNQGKKIGIEINGELYERWPIRTRVIITGDDLAGVIKEYAAPYWQAGDLVFLSEKIVAISQGRAYPIKDIKPSKLANFLVKYVHKSAYGIGLGSPWTMELAIREAGAWRILLAAAIAALTKPLGIKGLFYRVAGKNINAIDGPCSYTLPPYNEYAELGPKNPDQAARDLAKKGGNEIVIIDANDLGVAVLGKSSDKISDEFCHKVFSDNPLGQTTEQTPICLVRKK